MFLGKKYDLEDYRKLILEKEQKIYELENELYNIIYLVRYFIQDIGDAVNKEDLAGIGDHLPYLFAHADNALTKSSIDKLKKIAKTNGFKLPKERYDAFNSMLDICSVLINPCKQGELERLRLTYPI